MVTYEISRNIESSVIDYIKNQFDLLHIENISYEKTFARVYEIPIDPLIGNAIICVRLTNTDHIKNEVGGSSTRREPIVVCEVFASSDGQRSDLKDLLVKILRSSIPYFEYVIDQNGNIIGKNQNGSLKIKNTTDEIVNLGSDYYQLEIHDRYRHQVILTIAANKVEV